MKEDILEQLAADYLEAQGYFTRANIRFRPTEADGILEPRQDSVHSDIDVVGFHPKIDGPEKVMAVSCKSLQEGFDPDWEIMAIKEKRIVGGRDAWRRYRELANKKWAMAFRRVIREATGSEEFIYVTAVTRLVGKRNRSAWQDCESFKENIGAEIRLLTLEEMIGAVLPILTTTLASSELGRTLQLFKAAGLSLKFDPMA